MKWNPQRLRRALVRSTVLGATTLCLLPATGAGRGPIVITLPDARDDAALASAELARIRTLRDRAEPNDQARLGEVQRLAEKRRAEIRQTAEDAAARRARTAADRRRANRTQWETTTPTSPVSAPLAAANRANPFLNGQGQRQADYATTAAPTPSLSGGLAAQLDTYLAERGSPLAGLGATFVAQAGSVGLDPRVLVAITGAETSFGTYGPAQAINNPFGLGPHIEYPSWGDSVAAATRTLSGEKYRGAGRVTIGTIQPIWAPLGAVNDPVNLNSNWTRNVARYYADMGGNPAASVFNDGAAPTGFVPTTIASLAQGNVAAPVAYGPGVAVPGGGSGVGPAAVNDALKFLGMPYLWGGEDPSTGFDCSGLVQYVYGRHGVKLPRVAEAQAQVGIPVPPESLQAGDALFFADSSGYIHHEGMYLGGGFFIASPKTGDVIKISSLYDAYYASQFAGARRY